mmetsp:Transcript_28224/g.28017  ORF Transcript_28224/g.28017 Transcript_28224/m.28017 type:complete len:171 (+) Transcript_28224:449-961(+)
MTDKSNTSMASDLTKNSRSDAFDRTTPSAVAAERKSKVHGHEAAPKKGIESPNIPKSTKKTTKPFVPKDRVVENVICSSSFKIKFLLNTKEIWKTVKVNLLKSPIKDMDIIELTPWNAIVGLEMSKLVDTIISEINSEIDLRHALKLYMIELLQTQIQEGKLFGEFLSPL